MSAYRERERSRNEIYRLETHLERAKIRRDQANDDFSSLIKQISEHKRLVLLSSLNERGITPGMIITKGREEYWLDDVAIGGLLRDRPGVRLTVRRLKKDRTPSNAACSPIYYDFHKIEPGINTEESAE